MAGDTTVSTPSTICVAPLASPHSLLPRAHTYLLIVTLLLPLPRGWLFRAALAAFTTRTAIYVVDAIVHLARLRSGNHGPFSLDVFVVTEVLSLASFVGIWLLLTSKRGGESSARGLIRAWTGAVAIGTIISFVALKESVTHTEPAEPDRCDGVIMDRLELLGPLVPVQPNLGIMGNKVADFTLRVGISGVILASLALLATSLPRPTTATHGTPTHDSAPGIPLHVSTNVSDITSTEIIRKKDESPVPRIAVAIAAVLILGLPFLAVFVAFSTERYLLKEVPNLPSIEAMSSVGQWGVWAATGVVVIGTASNAIAEKMGLKEDSTEHSRPQKQGEDYNV
jgi:hypothetical protein